MAVRLPLGRFWAILVFFLISLMFMVRFLKIFVDYECQIKCPVFWSIQQVIYLDRQFVSHSTELYILRNFKKRGFVIFSLKCMLLTTNILIPIHIFVVLRQLWMLSSLFLIYALLFDLIVSLTVLLHLHCGWIVIKLTITKQMVRLTLRLFVGFKHNYIQNSAATFQDNN